jgi:hypothetical protein
VEAIGFHFYDSLKIILSFSALRLGLESTDATQPPKTVANHESTQAWAQATF